MKKIRFKLPKLGRFKSVFRLFNAYFVSTISITFVLILAGVIILLVSNGQMILKKAKESVQLIVIIKPSIPEADILLFQKELDRQPFTRSTEYISKEQGLEEMKSYLGSDIVDVLDSNPLPPLIKVYLNADYSSYDQIQKVTQWLTQQNPVDDVFFNESIVYQLSKNLRIISTILGVITFLFVLIALALINNTIRLMVYSKRQEIKTMQLVGASDWFIMRPFILNSMFQGFLSALIADTVIVLSLIYIRLKSHNIFEVYHLELSLILVVIIGILITGLATFFAVKHYLWAEEDEIWA